jgi:hypothetical protein
MAPNPTEPQPPSELGSRNLEELFPTPFLEGITPPPAAPTPPARSTLGPITFEAQAAGRAAIIGDSTRMGTANNSFLTSAIPVKGGPFFGAPAQAAVSGTGSLIGLTASSQTTNGGNALMGATLVANSMNIGSPEVANGGQSVVLQAAFVQLNRFYIGTGESAFANPLLAPDILDTAGPNARVTVLAQGSGMGQGRLSFTWLTSDAPDGSPRPGFQSLISAEAPVVEIRQSITTNTISGNTSSYSRMPDLISTTIYNGGDMKNGIFDQVFNIQSSTVFRSLGLENDSESVKTTTFGWGESLSGVLLIRATSPVSAPDVLFTSVTAGQGISHYIVDLQTATTSLKLGGNDAIFNSGGTLVPLPVVAWYSSFLHNWTDSLRSSITYSQTQLGSFNSTNTLTPTTGFAYREGQYAGINLVYHEDFWLKTDKSTTPPHTFIMGLEYLYGQKKTLNGALGQDDRLLFAISVIK